MIEVVLAARAPVKVLTLGELLRHDYRFFIAFAADGYKYILTRHVKAVRSNDFYWQSTSDDLIPTISGEPYGGRGEAIEEMLKKGYKVVGFDTYTEMMEWLLNNK